jgi:hypothetical protein
MGLHRNAALCRRVSVILRVSVLGALVHRSLGSSGEAPVVLSGATTISGRVSKVARDREVEQGRFRDGSGRFDHARCMAAYKQFTGAIHKVHRQRASRSEHGAFCALPTAIAP